MNDEAFANVITAIANLEKAQVDPHRWSRREQARLKLAKDTLMQVTGELENLEIGAPSEDVWSVLTERE